MEEKFELIKAACLNAETDDPIALAVSLMENERIGMHGPEHHVLDGSCLLAALHHAGMGFDLNAALDEMAARGRLMPGATCGKWGMCGSAASVGAALSVIHGTGPLSGGELYKDNLRLVSRALGRIAEVGGPRCCKRNAFLSLGAAVDFVEERYGIQLAKHEIVCEFSHKNAQCLASKCPFFGGEHA